MDDILVLAPTRWKIRKAVKAVNGILGSLGLEKHPDKTFIGRIERGFDFLGYHFGTDGLSVVKKTIEQFIACDPALRAGAGGALRLSPAWIIRAAVAQMDMGRIADDHPPQGFITQRTYHRRFATLDQDIDMP